MRKVLNSDGNLPICKCVVNDGLDWPHRVQAVEVKNFGCGGRGPAILHLVAA